MPWSAGTRGGRRMTDNGRQVTDDKTERLESHAAGARCDDEIQNARRRAVIVVAVACLRIALARRRLRGQDRAAHGRRGDAGGAVRGGGGKERHDHDGNQRHSQGHRRQIGHPGILDHRCVWARLSDQYWSGFYLQRGCQKAAASFGILAAAYRRQGFGDSGRAQARDRQPGLQICRGRRGR